MKLYVLTEYSSNMLQDTVKILSVEAVDPEEALFLMKKDLKLTKRGKLFMDDTTPAVPESTEAEAPKGENDGE